MEHAASGEIFLCGIEHLVTDEILVETVKRALIGGWNNR